MEGRERRKVYAFRVRAGNSYSTFAGSFKGSDIIGLPWGSSVKLDRGVAYLLRPTLHDMIMYVYPRRSQVIYPKDAGYIVAVAGLAPGMRVLEAGAGSGFLTIWLAAHVCPGGSVYSYEVRDDMLELATKNVEASGFSGCVAFRKADVRKDVEDRDLDAAFLDMPDPWDALPVLHEAMKPSAPVVVFTPTVNQVIRLTEAVRKGGLYAVQEVSELIKREWEARHDALRPAVRTVMHTGFITVLRTLRRNVAKEEIGGVTSQPSGQGS
ncbi:MAG: tRNA (adenine-N1)-methyltransferase [Acidilobus sp.]